MRLFEIDMFDERINAVQNKAGRIAYHVLLLLLMLMVILVEWQTGETNGAFTMIIAGAIVVSFIVEFVFENHAGHNQKERDDLIRRLGRSNKAKNFSRKHVIVMIMIGVFILTRELINQSLTPKKIIAALCFLVVMTVVSYFINNHALYGRILPPKNKLPVQDGTVSIIIEQDVFDERIRALRNRAGRIAWDVLVMLLVAIVMMHTLPGAEGAWNIYLIIMPAVAVSWLAGWYVETRAGVTAIEINEYVQRMTNNQAFIDRYMRIVFWKAVEMVLLFSLWSFPFDDITPIGFAIRIAVIPLAIWGMYRVNKWEFYQRFGIKQGPTIDGARKIKAKG